MADDDRKGPRTWGEATRMLQKGEKNVTDDDIFGDPLAPNTKKKADAYGYLGHFANDDVAEEGHNVGAKKLGIKRMGNGKIAAKGFRTIPGNASTGYVDRKTRAAMDKMDSMLFGGTVPRGPIGAPTKAPLRDRERNAKKSAPKARGPLRSKHR